MRPTLYLQPIHTSSAGILQTFMAGKPLSVDQTHFLDWHEKQLSNAFYDPIINYYLRTERHRHSDFHGVFLLPHEAMNLDAIQLLKKRILASLKNGYSSAIISATQKQFLDFKHYTINELIFWHGNQFLNSAPFYPNGIPPVIYFQWGNLFGVVKYVVLPAEKALKANLLIYFEDMLDRDLDHCVQEYVHHLKQDMKLQNEIVYENKVINLEKQEESVHTPKFTPSNYFLLHHY